MERECVSMAEAEVIANVQPWNDRTTSSHVRVTVIAPRVASLEEVQLSKETVSRERERAARCKRGGCNSRKLEFPFSWGDERGREGV